MQAEATNQQMWKWMEKKEIKHLEKKQQIYQKRKKKRNKMSSMRGTTHTSKKDYSTRERDMKGEVRAKELNN